MEAQSRCRERKGTETPVHPWVTRTAANWPFHRDAHTAWGFRAEDWRCQKADRTRGPPEPVVPGEVMPPPWPLGESLARPLPSNAPCPVRTPPRPPPTLPAAPQGTPPCVEPRRCPRPSPSAPGLSIPLILSPCPSLSCPSCSACLLLLCLSGHTGEGGADPTSLQRGCQVTCPQAVLGANLLLWFNVTTVLVSHPPPPQLLQSLGPG